VNRRRFEALLREAHVPDKPTSRGRTGSLAESITMTLRANGIELDSVERLQTALQTRKQTSAFCSAVGVGVSAWTLVSRPFNSLVH
jgi:hypothetical protein